MFTIRDNSHFYQVMIETLGICFEMSEHYNSIAADYLRYFHRDLNKDGNVNPFFKFNIKPHLEKILDDSKVVFKNCAALFHYVSEPESDMLQFKFMKRFHSLQFLSFPFVKGSDAPIEFNFRIPTLIFNDFITLKEKGTMDEDFHSSRIHTLLHIKQLCNDVACILYVAKFMYDYTSRIDVNDNAYPAISWQFETTGRLPECNSTLAFVNDAISEALLLTPYSD